LSILSNVRFHTGNYLFYAKQQAWSSELSMLLNITICMINLTVKAVCNGTLIATFQSN